jgi:RimJ/RimL family protein N-acetyltransferase
MEMRDFPWYAEFWTKPEIVEFIGGSPRSIDQSWMRFLMNFGSWSQLGFGFWIITRKLDASPIGLAGIFDAGRPLPALKGMPEAGWALTPEEFGKGFAEEAMRGILSWADKELVFDEIACLIDAPNRKSMRIAERLGFERFGSIDLDGVEVTTWCRCRRTLPVSPTTADSDGQERPGYRESAFNSP